MVYEISDIDIHRSIWTRRLYKHTPLDKILKRHAYSSTIYSWYYSSTRVKGRRSVVFIFDFEQSNRSIQHINLLFTRSSHPDVFFKTGVLRNFAKLTEKHLCQSLYFNKVAGPRPATFLRQRFWRRCFPVNLAIFLRTPFVTQRL